MTAPHRIASSSPSPFRLRTPSGGKLATGDAATLGMMVFYNWREKKLAKDDPEGYARLQRLKALFRAGAPDATQEKRAKEHLHNRCITSIATPGTPASACRTESRLR